MLDNPRYWVLKSEKALVIAEAMTTQVARDTMMRVAENYDHLARLAQECEDRQKRMETNWR